MHYHRNTFEILNMQVVTLSHASFFSRDDGNLKKQTSRLEVETDVSGEF